jgi:hypothetical protein
LAYLYNDAEWQGKQIEKPLAPELLKPIGIEHA